MIYEQVNSQKNNAIALKNRHSGGVIFTSNYAFFRQIIYNEAVK